MSKRAFVIGDIHGCACALNSLLRAIEPAPDDLLVTLGDYVDRGPDSAHVIDQLIDLSQSRPLIPLLGNHEIMLLTALDNEFERGFWLQSGGQQTVQSYGGEVADIPERHLQFIRQCRRYHETDDHFFVHANYVPDLPLEQQPDFVLFWEHLTSHMPGRHLSGKRAVVGHTPQRRGEPLILDHLVCIDTFCYGGGWLTALEIATGQYWQANEAGELRIRPGHQPA